MTGAPRSVRVGLVPDPVVRTRSAADRRDLGDFLRRRREQIQPSEVGLPPGGRRRTPGLRRDEVALLATMSVDYYERIEQARSPQPSTAMLGAIARALRLSLEERDHLYLLAGHQPPHPHVALGQWADPGLMAILDALAPHVGALITDDLSTVLAQNPVNIALLGPLVGAGRESNFTWRWFTDPAYRVLYAQNDIEALSRGYVADLRAAVTRRGMDAESRSLVQALEQASEEFRALWELHEVASPQRTRKILQHPMVGRLDCECDVVVSPPSRQRLVLFRGAPGTDAPERLAMLAVLGTQDLRPASEVG